jgi:A-factor type gamma-butyrolactone 1'-reductase (1S-forming)
MRSTNLAGNVVLIIGASRGIGAATATAFAREGAKLVLASRDVAAMNALVAGFPAGVEARVVRTDITVPADIARAVAFTLEQFGRLDIAFNNAGATQKRAPLAEVTDEVFDATMNTNVRGVFIAMKHEITAMLAGGGGSIVNTGSITSVQVMANMSAYSASKHALAGLTKAAALDYAAQNIRVNMVAPGAIDTAMTQGGILATEAGRKMISTLTPMQRIGQPEEIAAAVLWLSSSAASFVTGAILPADGGFTLP